MLMILSIPVAFTECGRLDPTHFFVNRMGAYFALVFSLFSAFNFMTVIDYINYLAHSL